MAGWDVDSAGGGQALGVMRLGAEIHGFSFYCRWPLPPTTLVEFILASECPGLTSSLPHAESRSRTHGHLAARQTHLPAANVRDFAVTRESRHILQKVRE